MKTRVLLNYKDFAFFFIKNTEKQVIFSEWLVGKQKIFFYREH